MKDYRELKVWEKAHKAALTIYSLTKNFPKEEQFNLVSQIRRSAVSVPTNIAEGTGKLTNLDLAKFLQISLGSPHEVEYLLLLSFDLNFIEAEDYKNISTEIGEIKAMLISLIKKVRRTTNFGL